MAKAGFPYYRAETDRFQDIRIKRLKKEFKGNGYAVYSYILNEIYRVKGCYMEWDESTAFDVSEYWDLKESFVEEVVKYCCAIGLFDKGLFTSGRVITSQAIQSRYIEMSKLTKRTNFDIPKEICLLPEEKAKLPEETPKLPEETPKDPEVLDKEEYSKEEKRNIPSIPAYEGKFPSDVFEKSLPDCYNALFSDQIWWESVCMNNHITAEQFMGKLQEFFKKLQNEGEKTKSVKDGQSHFARWLAVDIQKQKPNKPKSFAIPKKGKIEELKEVGDSSLEIARKILNGNG